MSQPFRDPSIHVTRSTLIELIRQGQLLGHSGESLVDYLLESGKKYNLFHRSKLDNYDSKAKKVISKLKMSNVDAARLFAKLLVEIRRGELKHKGVTVIREGTQEWATIKEVTSKAIGFAEAFEMDFKQAFITYIRQFFKIAGKGRINIKTMAGKADFICAIHEAELEIVKDATPDTTQKAYLEYAAEVGKRTGIRIDYSDQPTKYVYFIYAKELAKKFGITPSQYIRASFETLDWTNGIPAPSQLVTKNNEDRIIKWMAENQIAKMHVSQSKASSKEFWARIKSYENRTQQQ